MEPEKHNEREQSRKRRQTSSPQEQLLSLSKVWGVLVSYLGRIWRGFFLCIENSVERHLPTSERRYVAVGLVFMLALLLVIAKIIFFIFSDRAEQFRKLGKELNRPVSIPLEPIRGSILSSDDRAVAVTAPVYRMYFDFDADAIELLHREPKNAKEIAAKDSLGRTLSTELDMLAVELERSFAEQGIAINKEQLRERWRKSFVRKNRYTPVIGLDISYLQYRELKKRPPYLYTDSLTDKQRLGLLPKITARPEMRAKRIYPFGSLAKRTIGDVFGQQEKNLSQGKNGIELGLDSLLRGKVGKGRRVYAAQTHNEIVIDPAVDGYYIHTTLNMDIQNQLERIMRKQLSSFKAVSGSAILLDVPTAQVLAITNLSRGKNGDYVELQNTAVSDLSEPGSTFKVASMLVALDNGYVQADDMIDVGNGIWQVGGRNVRDHNAHNGGYGVITASQVIERSSNVGVAKIICQNFGSRPNEYVKQVRALGFGEDLTLWEIPGSAKAHIRMPQEGSWYGTTLAWMSFGYETQIPPMYTAAFFNAIANGGKLMRPYIVRRVSDKDGRTVREYSPTVVKSQIAKPQSIQTMQDMLRKVVTEGTGKKLNSKVVAVSGKSGTAQIAKGGSYRGTDGVSHQVSFCGYFPSENPRYTLMVVVREPSKEFAAGGGSMAGPVVKELAEAIISMEKPSSLDSIGAVSVESKRRHIARGRKNELMQLAQTTHTSYTPNPNAGQDAYVEIDTLGRERSLGTYRLGIVPAVIGMTATDANYLLLKQGYRVKFSGHGRVVSQSLSAGTRAARGAIITLVLEA